MRRREVKLRLEGIKAHVLYHKFRNFDVNTLLVAFKDKRRILSTMEGYKEVHYVANSYQPSELSSSIMENYEAFEEEFPSVLGVSLDDISFLSTGANMENLAVCEKTFRNRIVSCLATGGVGNALRAGVDKANWMQQNGDYVNISGTINVILLTNVTLTDGGMARAIITATEAKTAALQDMNARSSASPDKQATGTGTDNIIIISGINPDCHVRYTGGHVKIGELIAASTKTAVAEAIKKHEHSIANP
ncbi:MAG: adenosylcobinamide amidohydrolase [Thermoproteota archaeon]